MNYKYLILVLIGVFLILSFVKPVANASAQQLTICEDYEFKVNVNTQPVTLTFYIENDELFKIVPSRDSDITTLLHCGHTYKIIYEAEGYETYQEIFEVREAMPINPETRNINLVKGGEDGSS